MSPVRVTAWAALTSCLIPESLQLDEAPRETRKRERWKHAASSQPIMNAYKPSIFAVNCHFHNITGKAISNLWLLNNLHFLTMFNILLLMTGGDWKSASRLWLKTVWGDKLFETCVNKSYINLRRFSVCVSRCKFFGRMITSSASCCIPLQTKVKPTIHNACIYALGSAVISNKTMLCTISKTFHMT